MTTPAQKQRQGSPWSLVIVIIFILTALLLGVLENNEIINILKDALP